MSIHRHAAKRDSNEPQIVKRFKHHGWHCEQVSGKGLPDLMVFVRATEDVGMVTRTACLVDVKTPKGTLKPAQVKKWTALHALGIPVYVVRTEADVDALVGGTLAPWKPVVTIPTVRVLPRKGDAAKAREEAITIRTPLGPKVRKPNPHYTPPRSKMPYDAKEAKVFAPTICCALFEASGLQHDTWCEYCATY